MISGKPKSGFESIQPFNTACCEVRLIVLIILVPTACGLGIFVSVEP